MSRDRHVIINNTAVSYNDEGSGQVLILVHGWQDRGETFKPLSEQLGADFRCISIDLPNFGSSQETDSITSVEQYANFLNLFIKKLRLKDYVLVGHSMGGQIAIYATGNNLTQPNHLILLASAGVRTDKRLIKAAIKHASKALKGFIPAAVKNKLYKRIGSDYNTKLSPIHKKIIHNVLSFDVQKSAGKVNVPTLLIYGDKDVHTPPSMGKVLNQIIKESKFAILEDSNHWLHQTAAIETAKLIKDFIK